MSSNNNELQISTIKIGNIQYENKKKERCHFKIIYKTANENYMKDYILKTILRHQLNLRLNSELMRASF